jgi:hypothetical protein
LLTESALISRNHPSVCICTQARRLARVCSMSVVIPLTRGFCPKHFYAWHHRKSRTASAYIRMSFATGRTREPHVASPDALLQFGNGVLGSDFGGLIPNSIKYIIGFK